MDIYSIYSISPPMNFNLRFSNFLSIYYASISLMLIGLGLFFYPLEYLKFIGLLFF